MSRTSRKVRRFEKEAILRAKVNLLFYSFSRFLNLIEQEFEYRREQSDSLLSKLHQNPNDEDYDQHRKHLLMRRIQQVLREDRNQTEAEEEYNQRKPSYDLNRTQSTTTTTTTNNSSTKKKIFLLHQHISLE